jgi:hypothetical protein
VEILQLTALTSLLSVEYPTSELVTLTVNSTIAPSLLSLPSELDLNCQTSTELAHSPTNHCTEPAGGPRYIASGRTLQKTRCFYCCALVCFRENVFTQPLFGNRLYNPVVLLLGALPSNGRCWQGHRLASGLYTTICCVIGINCEIMASSFVQILNCCGWMGDAYGLDATGIPFYSRRRSRRQSKMLSRKHFVLHVNHPLFLLNFNRNRIV